MKCRNCDTNNAAYIIVYGCLQQHIEETYLCKYCRNLHELHFAVNLIILKGEEIVPLKQLRIAICSCGEMIADWRIRDLPE